MHKLYERIGVIATIDPKDQNNQSGVLSDAVDMSKFSEILAILFCGEVELALIFLEQRRHQAGSVGRLHRHVVGQSGNQRREESR